MEQHQNHNQEGWGRTSECDRRGCCMYVCMMPCSLC